MRLTADFVVPERDVAVTLDVPAGSTTAIVGPNGSGKSTVLGVLAGLVDASGFARLEDMMLFDRTSSLPPHRRGTSLLSQQPRLFPRMTALDNVEFALRARRAPLSGARDWLRLVAADDLAGRRPSQLSGGQAQRVAIARALAAEPALLLLDEPLAALDTAVAAEIRTTLRDLLAERTALLVTHEILDAALLADEVIVLSGGRILEAGPTAVVLSNPRSDFAAQLCGLNLLRGTATGPDAIATSHGVLKGAGALTPGAPAVAAFAPSAVAVYPQPPHGSPRNLVAATITAITAHAQTVRVTTDAFAADLTPAAVAELRLAPGVRVHLSVKATEVRLYPA